MSQLFTAVYEVNSAVDGGPTLRLNLVVDGRNDSVVGHVQLDDFSGAGKAISVRGITWKSTASSPCRPSCWPVRRRFFPAGMKTRALSNC